MTGHEVPVLLPCHGVGADGARVEDVARDLRDRGLADLAEDVDEVLGAVRAGREVVALDGCAAACQTRLLEAHGVPSSRAAEVAETLEEPDLIEVLETAASPARRARRPPRVIQQAASGRNHTPDDYLLAVDALTSHVVDCGAVSDTPTLASYVARILGVSRATAGEMVARLEEQGLIRRVAHREVLLTPAGRAEADRLLRAQRILECFVVTTLGYAVADCHDRARELAPGFGPESLERLWTALGRPERCPHGRPVDGPEARRTVRELRALTAVDQGRDVTVDRLEDSSRERLRALADAGVQPGRRLVDVRVSGAAGMVAFTVDGRKRAISSALADSVLVR